MTKKLLPFLLLLPLCGCFKTKDELTILADGSGSVRLETHLLIASETLEALGFGMSRGTGIDAPSVYPPTSEIKAKQFFPGKQFVVTVNEEKKAGGSLLVITAAFKDVNALLASPYGRSHGLSLTISNGTLSLKAVIGIEAAARLAEMKDDSGLFGERIPGLDDLKKKKDEMRAEFRVTLPNTVASASAGGARDAKTVTWIADRTKQTNSAEFSRQAGALLEAGCPADGLKFSPVAPARLGMLPFRDAPAGVITRGTIPDTNKIAAAVKFVPCALQVTRALDLSGEGGSLQNNAQLAGVVVLPKELAPQKWGELKIDEVVDAKGTSLKLPRDDNEFPRIPGGHFDEEVEPVEGDDEEGVPSKKSNEPDHRHTITIAFQPPDWKVKEIARIRGSIALHYFSGAQVVKISNAIPAQWVREMKSETDFSFEPQGQTIDDPKLREIGLVLQLTMGMSQGSFLSLMFDTSASKASVTDAQIYDADGRPWPTFFLPRGFGGADAIVVMVAGKPKPPLSLAVVASGEGATFTVPIRVEKVPVGPK